MGITNAQSGTNVHEIADGLYRINTPVTIEGGPGGFSFNQYLIVDDEPLIFHTGPRKMFPLVREAVASVVPVERLRYIAFSHVEADECGSLNEWLAVAPHSSPLCGTVAAMVSISDLADRPPRPLADGETLSLGKHLVRWFDTPHLPHSWECGYLMEESTRTLLCGDLFTQGGDHQRDHRDRFRRLGALAEGLWSVCTRTSFARLETYGCLPLATNRPNGLPHQSDDPLI
jgi:flavorubredoxin